MSSSAIASSEIFSAFFLLLNIFVIIRIALCLFNVYSKPENCAYGSMKWLEGKKLREYCHLSDQNLIDKHFSEGKLKLITKYKNSCCYYYEYLN